LLRLLLPLDNLICEC